MTQLNSEVAAERQKQLAALEIKLFAAEALIRPLLEELTSRHMLCDQCCQDSRQCRAKQAIKAAEKHLEARKL